MMRTFSTRLRAGLLAPLLLLAACGAQVELVSDLPEPEANEVLSALLDANIRASKTLTKEGVRLTVEQSQVARAITVMRSEGLPRERFARMGEVFRKEGMISSPLEERARYLWALSQELSNTVNQIDGVLRARVHVVLPERSSGADPAMPSSAAVFIKYKRGYNLDDSVAQVKRLVASSIPGLTSERVSVVLLASGRKQDDGVPAGGTRVWGMTVPAQSASSLSLVLWSLLGMLLLTLLAAAGLAWRLWGKPIGLAGMPNLPAGLAGLGSRFRPRSSPGDN